jgi:subtilisin-like proprotein convertase family protein
MRQIWVLVAVSACLLAAVPGTAAADTVTFFNTSPITIPDNTTANSYPSSIAVSGMSGTVTKVTATLSSLTHSAPCDIDALLVGPGGNSTILMSDAGGCNPGVSGVTLTFDDAASSSLTCGFAPTPSTGSFKPTDCPPAEIFPGPAPAGPYGTGLSAFASTAPNGAWSLYVVDDGPPDAGTVAGGWNLTISTPPQAATGRRAAALKRCKHKRGKARKKCRKKAKKLPV